MRKFFCFRIFAFVLPAVFCLMCAAGCAKHAQSFDTFAMGSAMNIKLYTSEEDAEKLFGLMNDEVMKCDGALSAHDENSELAKLNKKGYSKLSRYAYDTVSAAGDLCEICRGVDMTIGAVSALWDFDGDEPRVPSEKELVKALKTVSLSGVTLDDETQTVRLSEGQQLDLGAFGKGAALDEALRVLYGKDVPALVTFGGSVAVKGCPPAGKAWRIGIRDPFGTPNDSFAVLSLSPEDSGEQFFVSTSGTYEKRFEKDGKTYHHILSPETGMPVDNGLAAVTVVAPSGFTSDALSTACFIKGLNGETLLDLGSFGAEAVFVFSDGTYYVTDGLADRFALSGGTSFTEHPYEK